MMGARFETMHLIDTIIDGKDIPESAIGPQNALGTVPLTV